MKAIVVVSLYLALPVWIFGSWGVNLYKLVKCDWEAPYKEEVIRSIGVPVVPLSLVTCWIDFNENNNK